MEPAPDLPSIHRRRRGFYALWLVLLAAAAGFLGWWETPAREGTARVQLVLTAADFPAGARAALWTGSAKAWDPARPPTEPWGTLQGGRLAAGPGRVRIAERRWRQGLLMRRTDDLAIAILEAPSGERRYLVYDLREDLGGLLTIGRAITVNMTFAWSALPATAVLPAERQRPVVGH